MAFPSLLHGDLKPRPHGWKWKALSTRLSLPCWIKQQTFRNWIKTQDMVTSSISFTRQIKVEHYNVKSYESLESRNTLNYVPSNALSTDNAVLGYLNILQIKIKHTKNKKRI